MQTAINIIFFIVVAVDVFCIFISACGVVGAYSRRKLQIKRLESLKKMDSNDSMQLLDRTKIDLELNLLEMQGQKFFTVEDIADLLDKYRAIHLSSVSEKSSIDIPLPSDSRDTDHIEAEERKKNAKKNA